MGRKRRRQVEPDVTQLRKRVAAWRRTRTKRSPMPEELWDAAVSLAAVHGVYRISQDVGVTYDTLKARLARSGQRARGDSKGASTRSFVEIAPVPVIAHAAELEVEAATGAKLIIRLGLGAAAGLDVCGVIAALVGKGHGK